jgi:hypothetical protein
MRQWHPQRDGLAIGLAVSGSAAEILGLTDWLDCRLTQLSGGSPTFYVTHDQVQAMTMGDRVTVMRQACCLSRDRRAAATDQASPRRARSGTSATLALARVIPAVHLRRMRSIVKAGCT